MSVPRRRSIWLWLISSVVLVIVIFGFLATSQALITSAADRQSSTIENCMSCHVRELELHDKLGTGNKACWVCHDKTDMSGLHLADGTRLSLSNTAPLCGQCHQERYDAWKEGTHGIPGPSNEKCTDCHDPHQPQIALLNITKPHPAPAPSPSPSPVELLIILGISLALIIAVGVAVAMQGEGP